MSTRSTPAFRRGQGDVGLFANLKRVAQHFPQGRDQREQGRQQDGAFAEIDQIVAGPFGKSEQRAIPQALGAQRRAPARARRNGNGVGDLHAEPGAAERRRDAVSLPGGQEGLAQVLQGQPPQRPK